jgi:hypothetical protein
VAVSNRRLAAEIQAIWPFLEQLLGRQGIAPLFIKAAACELPSGPARD